MLRVERTSSQTLFRARSVPRAPEPSSGLAHRGNRGQEFHIALQAGCAYRRQIEKSSLAQIEMSLSTVLVGEFWADDGDCDEPDGDRPDERIAGFGGEQDQSSRSRDTD